MSVMWQHSYHICVFNPGDVEMGCGSVGFGMGPFKYGRNCAHATSHDGDNLPFLPPRAV